MNGHIRRRVGPSTGRISYQALVYVDKARGGRIFR